MWARNVRNKDAFMIIILKELLKYVSISTVFTAHQLLLGRVLQVDKLLFPSILTVHLAI